MEFCPECESVLLPKRGSSNELFCKVCGKVYKMDKKKNKEEYKIQHVISRGISSKTAVLDKKGHQGSISEDDRRAYEDYFQSGEQQ